MKLVPLADKVIVQKLELEEKTPGGIVLPDTAKEDSHQGKVLSIGDGRVLESGQRAPIAVNEGDRVLYAAYGGSEVTVDDEKLLIMSESDILAVIE